MLTYSYKQLKPLIKNLTQPHGHNAYGVCPKCGHNEFGISLKDGNVFGCFRKSKCGWSGNIYTLLSFLGVSFYLEKTVTSTLPELPDKNNTQLLDLELNTVIFPVFKTCIDYHPYLEDRSFNNYKKYEVWQDRLDKSYIYITIRQYQKPVAYIGRLLPNKEGQRYNNSRCDYKKILFGFDEIIQGETKSVIITEGIFDKFKVEDSLNLDYATDTKCVCTFKAGISDEQIVLLKKKGVEKIYLMYEPDVPKSVIKATNKLESHFDSVKICEIPEGEDPNSMTKKEIEDSFFKSESFVSCGHKVYKNKLLKDLSNAKRKRNH